MADIEHQARELLAAEYERYGDPIGAERARTQFPSTGVTLRAIAAALRTTPAKDQVRCIRLNINGEWGSFYLREGVSGEGERQNHWCELTCNTSFGTVGYYWGSMGRPAARFLAKIDRGYALNKLWGADAHVFDAKVAMDQARAVILSKRKAGDLSSEQARDRWDDLADHRPTDEFEFREMVYTTEWLYAYLCDGHGPIGQVANPQAIGFWEELWPAFIAELVASTEPVTLATVKPPSDLRTKVPPVAEIKECTNG